MTRMRAAAGRALLDAEVFVCACGKSLARGPSRLAHVRDCRGSVHKEMEAAVRADGPDAAADGVEEVDAHGVAVAAPRPGGGRGGRRGGAVRARGGGRRGRGGLSAAPAPLLAAMVDAGALTDPADGMDEAGVQSALAEVCPALEQLRQRCVCVCASGLSAGGVWVVWTPS